MAEAMLRGWRAQQAARGLRAETISYRERLVRRFQGFTNEYPWRWGPRDVDEWTLTLTSERHLAPSTIRGYQTDLRLFSEYLTDGRYGWAAACQEAFGTFPVPICHEWNTIAHLSEYEGSPEARPLSRGELQRFLDYADDQVERAARTKRKGAVAAYREPRWSRVVHGGGRRPTGQGTASSNRRRRRGRVRGAFVSRTFHLHGAEDEDPRGSGSVVAQVEDGVGDFR